MVLPRNDKTDMVKKSDVLRQKGTIGGFMRIRPKRKTRRIVLYAILICITVLFLLAIPEKSAVEQSENGKFQYQVGSLQLLAGEWEFAWHALLDADAFNAYDKNKIALVRVPDMWNNYAEIPWDTYDKKGYGYGTFRLQITGLEAGTEYGLRIRNLGTAEKIWADDVLLLENGAVSDNAEEGQGQYSIHYVSFAALQDTVTLIVQISNYEYARGGFWVPITMGEQAEIQRLYVYNVAKTYLLIGILLAVLIFCIALAFNIREKSGLVHLFLGALMVILYIMSTGDKLLLQLFPALNGNAIRIQYMVMYAAPLTMLRYVNAVVSGTKRYMPWLQKIIWRYSIAMLIATWTLPIARITEITYIGNFLATAIALFTLAVLILEAVRYQEEVAVLIIALYLLGLGGVHDCLYSAVVIYSTFGELISITYVGFSILVTMHFAMHIKKAYDISKKVPALEQAYLNAQIKPHFLFNTLNSIVSLIDSNPEKAEDMTIQLSRHFRHIMGFENLQKTISITQELEMLNTYIRIERIRFPQLRIELQYDAALLFDIPPFTLQPLVENAIKYGTRNTAQQEYIEVSIQRRENGIVVQVSDNGKGVSQETLQQLRSALRFGEREPAAADKAHIGLYNVNLRLKNSLGVELCLESELDNGFSVWFCIAATDGKRGTIE